MGNNFNSIKLGSTQFDFRPYTTCTTGATDATKVVSVANFSLFSGASVTVKFSNKNNVANPKLNVTNTGAKSIYYNGVALPSTQYWEAGAVIEFIYDGTNWNVNGTVKDNNTKYSAATASASGLVSTGNQTFGGVKTLKDGAVINTSLSGSPYEINLSSDDTHDYSIIAYDTTTSSPNSVGIHIGCNRILEISGKGGVEISGEGGMALKIAGSYGNSGQVLKSNGAGVYWGTDNSGSTSYSAGTGILISSNTVSAKLRSTTALTIDSSAATTTTGRVYPVVPDKSGYLSVNVPWSDTNTKVTQNSTTTNGSFPLLLKYTNNTTNETNTTKYGTNLTYNPSTSTLKFGVNGTISNNSGVTIKNDNTSLTSASYIKLETSGNNAQIDLDAPLVNAQGNLNINGNLSFTGYIPSMVFFGYCSSGVNVVEKEITVDNGFPSSDIPIGTLLIVYFSNSNSTQPEFYINGEGAYNVIYGISNNYSWAANSCIPFVFTGSEFRVVGKLGN